MGIRHFRYHLILVYSFCLLLTIEGLAQDHNESGLYPVYNFSPEDYNALTQNWCALQDQRGIMYFGNNQWVLEYDGVNWNQIIVGEGSQALSMDIDQEGRIYIGSDNEFGYMEVDSAGTMKYRSLSDLLSDDQRDFNLVRGTHVTPMGVIFRAFSNLFIWAHDSLLMISGEEEIIESFLVNGNLFIQWTKSGLARLDGYDLVPVQGTDILSGISIFGMVPLNEENILIATAGSGLYKLEFLKDQPDEVKVNKVHTSFDRLFESAEIDNAIRIDEERISLGTYGNGAMIIDTAFNLVTILNKESGLRDDVVQGQFVDRTGNLWLALSNGISRVEIQSPITHFSDLQGLPGAVQSVTRFNKTIYAITNHGLFYMDHEYFNPDLADFTQPVFRQVTDQEIESWDLLTYLYGNEEILLLVNNDGIYEINNDNDSRELLEDWVNVLYQSNLDPARVYIGLENGLASMYRKNGTWIQEARIEGITEYITSIIEDPQGNLWMGTPEEGVLKVYIEYTEDGQIKEVAITRYNEDHGLPGGQAIVSQLKRPLLVGTNQGIYCYNLHEDMFMPDSTFGIPFIDGSQYIHRMIEFMNPEYWIVTWDVQAEKYKYWSGYFTENPDSTFSWISEPFASLSEGLVHSICLDSSDVVWLAGDKGLYRYNLNNSKDYDQSYNAYLRNIEFSEGGNLFGGTYMDDMNIASLVQPDILKPILPYRNNSLLFNYAALDGEDESFMRFRSFLEGNDKDWSEWTDIPFRTYTNLHEKKYTFHVKAKNIYGKESTIATYEFTILAPWYRKWWAYMLYAILAAIIIYIIVVVYTRQLREIIRDRTAEVVAQKEVIEEKNKDIMASIQYAEKIQRAMLHPEDDLSKLELDGFILFLPRDVVSGDFYWLSQREGKTITVAADCTGHGVPGAFMSMLGVAFLNKIVEERHILTPSLILDELRAEVISALRQKGHEGEQKDGMDLALHIIDYENMKVEYAGANNPLILIRNNEIIQFKGDRMPIGIHERAGQPFINHEFEAVKGDCLYTFSDGFQDQFGGPNNKKFMIKTMKKLLLDNHMKPMVEQKKILHKAFCDWIEPWGTEQIDDIIIIGNRI